MARVGEYGVPGGGGRRLLSGVPVGLYPSTQPRAQIELQRSLTTVAANFDTVAIVPNLAPGSVQNHYDVLPASTQKFYYRARHVRREYTASAWTRIVSSTVGELEPYQPRRFRLRLVSTAAQIGAPNSLLDLGNSSYNDGFVYSNTTAWIPNSTEIRQDNTVEIPIGGVYRVHVRGNYSSASSSPALQLFLNPTSAAAAGFNGTVIGSWGRKPSATTDGAFSVDIRYKFNAGDRVSLYRFALLGAIQFDNKMVTEVGLDETFTV